MYDFCLLRYAWLIFGVTYPMYLKSIFHWVQAVNKFWRMYQLVHRKVCYLLLFLCENKFFGSKYPEHILFDFEILFTECSAGALGWWPLLGFYMSRYLGHPVGILWFYKAVVCMMQIHWPTCQLWQNHSQIVQYVWFCFCRYVARSTCTMVIFIMLKKKYSVRVKR